MRDELRYGWSPKFLANSATVFRRAVGHLKPYYLLYINLAVSIRESVTGATPMEAFWKASYSGWKHINCPFSRVTKICA